MGCSTSKGVGPVGPSPVDIAELEDVVTAVPPDEVKVHETDEEKEKRRVDGMYAQARGITHVGGIDFGQARTAGVMAPLDQPVFHAAGWKPDSEDGESDGEDEYKTDGESRAGSGSGDSDGAMYSGEALREAVPASRAHSGAGAGAGAGAGSDTRAREGPTLDYETPHESISEEVPPMEERLQYLHAFHPEVRRATTVPQSKFPTAVITVDGVPVAMSDKLTKHKRANPGRQVSLFRNFKMAISPQQDPRFLAGKRLTESRDYDKCKVEATEGALVRVLVKDLIVFVLRRMMLSTLLVARKTQDAQYRARGTPEAARRTVLAKNFSWAITVPSLWDDVADSFMVKAVIEAGFLSERDDDEWTEEDVEKCHDGRHTLASKQRLSLVREPMAAAIGSLAPLMAPIEVLKVTKRLKIGDRIVVLDCGGGTSDFGSFEVTRVSPSLRFRRILELEDAAPTGANVIDEHFDKLILDLLPTDADRANFRVDGHMSYLRSKWIALKHQYRGDPDSTMDDINESTSAKLRELIRDENPREGLRIKDDELCLSGELIVVEFYQELMNTILAKFVDVVKAAHATGASRDRFPFAACVLAGGFGSSQVFKEKFKDYVQRMLPPATLHAANPTALLPETAASLAVVNGALLICAERVLAAIQDAKMERRGSGGGCHPGERREVTVTNERAHALTCAATAVQDCTLAVDIVLRRGTFVSNYPEMLESATRKPNNQLRKSFRAADKELLIQRWQDCKMDTNLVHHCKVIIAKGDVMHQRHRKWHLLFPLNEDQDQIKIQIIKLARKPRGSIEFTGDSVLMSSTLVDFRKLSTQRDEHGERYTFKDKDERGVEIAFTTSADGRRVDVRMRSYKYPKANLFQDILHLQLTNNLCPGAVKVTNKAVREFGVHPHQHTLDEVLALWRSHPSRHKPHAEVNNAMGIILRDSARHTAGLKAARTAT